MQFDQMEYEMNRQESALSNVYEVFNYHCSLQIRTKGEVEQKCKINPRRSNHHKSDALIFKPSINMRQSNKSADLKPRTCEQIPDNIQVESQLRIKKKNIRVSQNSISRNPNVESCSSNSSRVGSIKGILKKRTLDSSFSSNSKSRSVSSGKSVKFNLQTGALRNQLNQWK